MPRGRHKRVYFNEQAGSMLLEVLAGGQGIVADKVIACLDCADSQALGLACKALQDEVAARWRRLDFGDDGLPAEVLRSKLLPKLRGVQILYVIGLADGEEQSTLQDFYRFLLALKRNGARVKAINISNSGLLLLRRRSTRLAAQLPAEQPHDWVLTADSLRQLEPAPHLEWLTIHPSAPIEAGLLQPLLRAPALETAQLFRPDRMTGRMLDLSACTQLQHLFLSVCKEDWSSDDLSAWLQGLQPAPCLQKLTAVHVTVDSQCLQHISSSLPALRTLSLQDCQLLEPADTNAGQEPLQPALPSLKRLDIWYFDNITPSDLALQQILLAATSLEQLRLGFPFCFMPFQGMCLPLNNPGLAQLEELYIEMGFWDDDFIHVEGDLLRQLAKYQRRLRELRMRAIGDCPTLQLHPQQATTQDVQAFLDAAPPGLELLQMHGFAHVQPELLVVPAAARDYLELDIN